MRRRLPAAAHSRSCWAVLVPPEAAGIRRNEVPGAFQRGWSKPVSSEDEMDVLRERLLCFEARTTGEILARQKPAPALPIVAMPASGLSIWTSRIARLCS